MATYYDLERLDMQYKAYMNYLGSKWLFVKECGVPADMIQYLEDDEEMERDFPVLEVIRKGRNLFKEFQ